MRQNPGPHRPVLQTAEQFVATLCETAPIGIFQTGPDGRAIYFNPYWTRVTGRTVDEGLGLDWSNVIHRDDRAQYLNAWHAAVDRKQAFDRVARVLHRDGGVRYLHVLARPVFSSDATFAGHTGTFQDVTETVEKEQSRTSEGQRTGESNLRREIEQLREADQRKNQFIAVLGHELRNPVAAISMAAETLRHLASGNTDSLEMIDIVRRQTAQVGRLLDDLLDVSRIAFGKIQLHKERVNVVEVIRTAVADRRTEFDTQQIALEEQLPSQPIWVDGDPTRLAQVIGNLLSNALKFTSRGGHVRLSASVEPSRRSATFEIRDDGAGIDPQMLGHIFETFNQAERSAERTRGGLGLGLALSRGLVELHGGRIEAQSSGLGKGATFRVTLPLADDHQADATTSAKEATHRRFRILIIDDSPDIVASLEYLLKLAGHELVVAYDGKSAIELARTVRPDVVFCDIGLPGLDGYAVARALRADPATASAYLIAVSGYAGEEDQRRSLEAGFDRHLNKPEGFIGLDKLLQSLPIGSSQPQPCSLHAQGEES